MSILLDAVTKEKRQNQTPIDLVTQVAPLASPSPKTSIARWLKQSAVLVGTVAVGVGGAWLMNELLQPTRAELTVSQSNQFKAAMVQTDTAQEHIIGAENMNGSADFSTVNVANTASEVRLAGKVALPIAKVYTGNQSQHVGRASKPLASVQSKHTQTTVTSTSIPALTPTPTPTSTSTSTDSGITLAHLQALSAEYDKQNSLNDSQAKVPQIPVVQSTKDKDVTQPIMLGKDANRREQEQIAALQYEVDNAAEDVKYGDTQAEEVEHNKLMHAFKAALQDVEYEHATAKPMSKGDLAPFPKTSDKLIPSYGDLPASVQLNVPEFNIVAHVYSTDPTQRWLNVDGAELQQGDKIDDKMTIIEIRPRDVILDIDGTEFKVPAI
ncbi:general secretion pathway protein GspB [Shewanella intestini]|uniref:General secretion pathway protein GspB n=1 Tax=Shewanella intestini TaxID=2017544 RepID=A0ABS5HY31_9GAMM|nr:MULTISPECIES: general secretion pathway protein GspB [Shewanella]MBR9726612.1 general secretion pathway protein GspB [Shewanella intestini]MRG34822.1 hypothetical protein [Shewanella sp. XMDDZSB0408]